jgi:hypothetical protein
VWLQHVLDKLVASKQSGGPLAGVMFWQAALRWAVAGTGLIPAF